MRVDDGVFWFVSVHEVSRMLDHFCQKLWMLWKGGLHAGG
jgi:hypothetical protein